MGDLSEHFNRSEFECKCGCGFDNVNPELIMVLEDLREFFGVPVRINSGCRCPDHNKAEGGADNSEHLRGNASDVRVDKTLPEKVYVYLDDKYKDKYGIGLYKNRVHIDVRPIKARWRG